LSVPVGPEGDPHKDQGLHQCTSYHTAPNTLHAEVEVEAEEAAEGDTDDVVAAYVDVGHERLPSAAHGHTCDGLDAVEDEGERQQRRELGHRRRHVLAVGEDVADVVPAQQDDKRDYHRQKERQHRHHHHRECRRLGVPSTELIAHPHPGCCVESD
ncbi:Os03g0572050, partial [Oryza sativa Japonica Group]